MLSTLFLPQTGVACFASRKQSICTGKLQHRHYMFVYLSFWTMGARRARKRSNQKVNELGAAQTDMFRFKNERQKSYILVSNNETYPTPHTQSLIACKQAFYLGIALQKT